MNSGVSIRTLALAVVFGALMFVGSVAQPAFADGKGDHGQSDGGLGRGGGGRSGGGQSNSGGGRSDTGGGRGNSQSSGGGRSDNGGGRGNSQSSGGGGRTDNGGGRGNSQSSGGGGRSDGGLGRGSGGGRTDSGGGRNNSQSGGGGRTDNGGGRGNSQSSGGSGRSDNGFGRGNTGNQGQSTQGLGRGSGAGGYTRGAGQNGSGRGGGQDNRGNSGGSNNGFGRGGDNGLGRGQSSQTNSTRGQGRSQGWNNNSSSYGRGGNQSQSNNRDQGGLQRGSGAFRFNNGVHNIAAQGYRGRLNIGQAPYVNPRQGSLQYLIDRRDHSRVNNFRVGYFYYSDGWRDNDFNYGYYDYSPYNNPCVVSPWYYYSCLPPYIAYSRIVIVTPPVIFDFGGTPYYWGNRGDDGYGSDDSSYRRDDRLDHSLNLLTEAFDYRDNAALDQLVGNDGPIAIYVDHNYSYSLQPDDFFNLLKDNINSVHTTDYKILDVRVNGNRSRVLAQQTYTDPWGDEQTMYQMFVFENRGDHAVITQFGTSRDRPW